MSASDKKKLRKEQNAEKATQRQQAQKREKRQLLISSIAFISLLAIILVTGLTVFTINAIKSSAIRERNTIALTLDGKELNNIQFSYYYIDTLNKQLNENSYMLMFEGLDFTKPLDEQKYEEGKTWADHFIELAATRARDEYALAQAAKKAGFTLPEEYEELLASTLQEKSLNAMWSYGYSSLDDYLSNFYCNGADAESYEEYLRTGLLAEAYYTHYGESLEYTDAERRAHEKGKEVEYNSFSYYSYFVDYSKYLEEGVTASDATDEQKQAAREAARLVAEGLTANTTPEALDKAIGELPVNEGKTVTSNKNTNILYSNISTSVQSWIADPVRKEGDTTYIANEITTQDADGNEVKNINGYSVVLFTAANDNTRPLSNVRHLLVAFEGGTYDPNSQLTTYSDEEKAKAKAEAEKLLAEWKDGEATETTFIELVKKNTDDEASAEDGGLYENIAPNSNYVANFLSWSIDESRQKGDTGIVETEYGYHIMYFSDYSDLNYRDSMIDSELLQAEMESWYEGQTSAVKMKIGNTRFQRTDIVLSPEEE